MPQDQKPRDAEVKAFESFEIKDEATGDVEAIIATLNVVDKDEDVITGDAIKSGSKVKMSSYGHDVVGFMAAGALPVGKGVVTVEGDKVYFRGKVFTSTERGRDTITVLKEMGRDQEWSFGYRVMGQEVPDEEWRKRGARRMLTKLQVFEVSPVIVGAGMGTRTVSAKEAGAALAEEEAYAEESTRATAGAKCLDPLPVDTPDPGAPPETDEEKARRLAEAETARLASEAGAAEVARLAEEKRLADEAAEIKRAGDEAAARLIAREAEHLAAAIGAEAEKFRHTGARHEVVLTESKLRADKVEEKRLADEAAAEFDRFQKTARWLGAA